MPSDTLLHERIAAIEPQLQDARKEINGLKEFREEMITQLAELNSNVKTLNWKIGAIIGSVVYLLNLLSDWGVKILLPQS